MIRLNSLISLLNCDNEITTPMQMVYRCCGIFTHDFGARPSSLATINTQGTAELTVDSRLDSYYVLLRGGLVTFIDTPAAIAAGTGSVLAWSRSDAP